MADTGVMTASTYQPGQVGTFAASSLVRVAADATIYEVAEAIADNDVGAVIVGIDSADGIVSERDLVRALAAHHDPTGLVAADIASTHLVYCDARASVEDAAERMMELYVRHLLIEVDGSLVGIVSARDLLGVLVAR